MSLSAPNPLQPAWSVADPARYGFGTEKSAAKNTRRLTLQVGALYNRRFLPEGQLGVPGSEVPFVPVIGIEVEVSVGRIMAGGFFGPWDSVCGRSGGTSRGA